MQITLNFTCLEILSMDSVFVAHTYTVIFLVETFQLNLSQTNSVRAELLVVDENCAANRLTL